MSPDRTRALRLALSLLSLIVLAVTSAVLADYVGPRSAFCEPGGGCEIVQYWARVNDLGIAVPIFGLAAYTMLFAGSLARRRGTLRLTGALAIGGALVACGLIALQFFVIHAFCSLCVVIDGLAIAIGVVGALLLRSAKDAPVDGPNGIRSPAWALWAVATFGPLAWPVTFPDPALPDAVRARWESGKVNVVEFVDFQCPHCRAMHPILRGAIEQSDADVALHRGVLAFFPGSDDVSAAYYCAVDEDRGERMADLLMASTDLSREGLSEVAERVGLDREEFARCLDDPRTAARVRADQEFARASDVSGAPTVWIGERAFLGFDTRSGVGEIREAIAATARGEGRRIDPKWYLALALVAVLLAWWGWRGRAR